MERWCPPSEKESGVTLTIPMTRGRVRDSRNRPQHKICIANRLKTRQEPSISSLVELFSAYVSCAGVVVAVGLGGVALCGGGITGLGLGGRGALPSIISLI